MKEKYGFVYIWYDRKHKRFYVGKHWGNEDDGYICSSSWMKRAYKKRPQDFKRKILKTNINDKKLLLIEEFKWLQLIKKKELGKKYYNLKNCIFNEWQSDENKLLTVGEKISKSKIGNTYGKGRKGIKCTEKQKKILSESHKGQKAWNKGIPRTKEEKEKISKANTGKTRTEKWKKELSKRSKGNTYRKGMFHSDETKQIISLKNKGKLKGPQSKEHKRKILESKIRNRKQKELVNELSL